MSTTQPEAQTSTPVRPGRDGQAATPVVAFLGTGRMDGPMAANLARGGLGVRVWNRTSSRAEALAAAEANGAALPLTSALLPRWRLTAASGHADDDLAAVYLTA